ncbi:MAG: nuclear transport factor 2 family protein [Candidatus Acidoferrales bacterium]|nr:nuclear transport factor 2 family protein [Candidatus Acidoferrales bacterium]
MNILRLLFRRRIARLGCVLLTAILLSPDLAQAQQSAAARIQRLEDIEEIRTVLTNYGRFLDAHDLVAYSNQFATDGEWVGGFGTGKGPAGVLALMEKNLGVTAKGKPGSTYHLLTNFLIDVRGDTASAWSRWNFVVTGADNKPTIMYGGHYDDTLVRENGHWKFKRRVAVNDIPHSDPLETK